MIQADIKEEDFLPFQHTYLQLKSTPTRSLLSRVVQLYNRLQHGKSESTWFTSTWRATVNNFILYWKVHPKPHIFHRTYNTFKLNSMCDCHMCIGAKIGAYECPPMWVLGFCTILKGQRPMVPFMFYNIFNII